MTCMQNKYILFFTFCANNLIAMDLATQSYFDVLEQELKKDKEFMANMPIPNEHLGQGPLAYSLDLFNRNYLLNVEKMNEVYKFVIKILNLKESMIDELQFRQLQQSIANLEDLLAIPDERLLALGMVIERGYIFGECANKNLMFVAKKFLIRQIQKWLSLKICKKAFADQLQLFSGQIYENTKKNFNLVFFNGPSKGRMLIHNIFSEQEIFNVTLILLDLIEDLSCMS